MLLFLDLDFWMGLFLGFCFVGDEFYAFGIVSGVLGYALRWSIGVVLNGFGVIS